MKNVLSILSFVVAALFSSQDHIDAQTVSDSTVQYLNLFLDQWHLDATNCDHEAYIGAMTGDGTFIGTDASEYWTTKEFSAWCKPYFEKKKTWNFHPLRRHVYTSADGSMAWFDELLGTQMGICRGSGVLEKHYGQWKIVHYVLSATIPNDMMKKVTGMKAGTDSVLIMKSIFDKYGLKGSILILEPETGRTTGYNRALWDSGYLPASTFKIPNLLIGLETGVIDTGTVFRWNGEKRRLPQWERDLSVSEALRVSCVPCFQELARKIGPERMASFLEKLEYPGMDVNKADIDLFWLEGNSRITPRQQADFARRLYEEKLPLKRSVVQAVKRMMIIESTTEYTISGKTGWAIRDGNNYGWFVGWIETKGRTYFVATMVEPENQDEIADFAAARKLITMEVMRILGIF